jgi:hypothetical protein
MFQGSGSYSIAEKDTGSDPEALTSVIKPFTLDFRSFCDLVLSLGKLLDLFATIQECEKAINTTNGNVR